MELPRPPSEAASIAMGGSSSKAAPPQDKPKGFTVRVSKRTTRPSRFHVHPHRLTLSFSPLTLSLHGQMSPAVAQQVQAAAAQSAPAAGGGAASNEAAYEEAFKQGYEYAVQQFMQQQQAQVQSGSSEQQLASLQQNNEEYERMVREKTESLRAREYRCAPP